MSLSNDINTTSTALSDIKDAIIAKGVTPSGNISTYATAISQISGGTPTGTISITDNGTYDVTNYASADVNVSGGGSSELSEYQVTSGVASKRAIVLQGTEFDDIEEISAQGMYEIFKDNSSITGDLVFNNLTTIGSQGLYNTFAATGIETASFPSLTEINSDGMEYTFAGCEYLTSLDLSAVETIGSYGMAYACQNCQSLVGVDLSSLTTVGDYGMQNAFSSWEGMSLTSIDLPSLKTVGQMGLAYCFQGCHDLTSVDLSSLETVGVDGFMEAFEGCRISSISFSSLQSIGINGFNRAFVSNALTTINFPILTHIGMLGLSDAFSSNFDGQDTPSIQSISFPALTSNSFDVDPDTGTMDVTAFDTMIVDADGATVHFPSNLQAVIGSWPSVLDGFGGTNTTVLFDLTATE